MGRVCRCRRIDQPVRLVGADLGREQAHQAPVRELGRRQRVVSQGHPLTGPGSGQGKVAVVEARSATNLDLGGARRRQPFAPIVLVVLVQQGVMAQVRWPRQRRPVREQARAAHGKHPSIHQPLRFEAGPAAAAMADRGVDILA